MEDHEKEPKEKAPKKPEPVGDKREAFEAWVIREHGFTDLVKRGDDGEYLNKMTQRQWAKNK